MIIVNLRGGIGNQMFQYACGRALALRSGDLNLKLDIEGLYRAKNIRDTHREYGLCNFSIKAEIISSKEAREFKYPFGFYSKLYKLVLQKVFRQYYVSFVPRILKLRGNVYLDGYFQSEKYFKDFEKEIREDLKPNFVSASAIEFAKKIRDSQGSVSVHVRRGDYVGHKVFGGICDEKYYEEALNKIKSLIGKSTFFVFSNDISWVKKNIFFPEETFYISSEKLLDHEEVFLMSQCSNNIIANSSFSWWAAWLNDNPNKIIIAPKKWAHGLYNKYKLRNIIPKSWITIKTH